MVKSSMRDGKSKQFALRRSTRPRVAAVLLERGRKPGFGRVCTDGTLPYVRHMEERALPNAARIIEAVHRMVD